MISARITASLALLPLALGGCAMPEWTLHPKGIAPTLTTPRTNRGGELRWLVRNQLAPSEHERQFGGWAEHWRGRLAQSTTYHVPPIEQVEESMQVWDGWGSAAAPEF